MKKIARENLVALYSAISGKYPLYVPVSDGTETNFAAYTNGANVDLDRLKTVKSPISLLRRDAILSKRRLRPKGTR